MHKHYKIAVLLGSLRKKSYGHHILQALQDIAPDTLSYTEVQIDDLPFYNEDIEESAPASWQRLRDEIKNYDGVLFLTPEYNRSIPAVLKNALDVGSRPYGQSVWSKKASAIISYSPGMLGGVLASVALRQVTNICGASTMILPEAYYGNITQAFDKQGQIDQKSPVYESLQKFTQAYLEWLSS